jgi:DNA modification methylase
VVPATILDPFVGSGTVPLVALAHGRHSIGIDLKRTYLDLAIQRLTPALAQLPLFGLAPRV